MPFISVEAVDSLITNTSALSQALMICLARKVPVDTNLLNTIREVIRSVLDAHLTANVHGIRGTAANDASTSAASESHLTADVPGDTTHPHGSPLVDEPGDAPEKVRQKEAGSKRIHRAARKSTTPQQLLRELPKFCRQRVPRSPLQGPRRDKQRVPFEGGKHLCKKHKPKKKSRKDDVKYWFFNAVNHSCQDCVSFCVNKHGIDIDVVSDNKEYTAQDYAKYNKDAEMLQFLQMLHV